jgi:hypothetical protein
MSENNRPSRGGGDIVRADDLGMTVTDVRRRWPQAVEYTGLDGSPCWRMDELLDLDGLTDDC